MDTSSIMTIVEQENHEAVKKKLEEKGYEVYSDTGTLNIIVHTPFRFDIYSNKGVENNVDEILDRIESVMIQAKSISNSDWFIASSHPELIRRHDLRRPNRKEVDMLKFTEWCGDNYFKMHEVWCHKYKDQRDEKNHCTTEQLLTIYKNSL